MDAVQGWQPGPGLWVPEKERYGPRWKNKCDKTQKNVLKTQKERFNRYVHVSVPGDQGHDHVYSIKHTSVDHSLPSRAGKIVSDTGGQNYTWDVQDDTFEQMQSSFMFVMEMEVEGLTRE